MSKKSKEEKLEFNLLDILDPTPYPQLRTVSLFGDIDEECIQEVCNSFLYLDHTRYELPTEEKGDTLIKPIEFYISTWGGDALGMFAIYDLMRMIREECPIYTFAIGKVMSAGVLLLAAGTKGKRRIGKNTRIMLHSVRGNHVGGIHSLENEMAETRWIQNQHTDALVEETKITKRKLNTMLNKKVDVYLSAEDAIKLGIADIIV
jgi:ATP-dependent Clp protease protease subunit